MILVSMPMFFGHEESNGTILESVRSIGLPDLYDRVARKHKFGPNSARKRIFSFLFKLLYFVGDRSKSLFMFMRQAQAQTSHRRWLPLEVFRVGSTLLTRPKTLFLLLTLLTRPGSPKCSRVNRVGSN